MRRLTFFDGSVLSLTLLGSLIWASCNLIPDLGATDPEVSVSYQETTATVTASWSRPANAPDSWDVYYEWTNARITGGNACAKADSTSLTAVTFVCGRAETTPGVMEFNVWAVRRLAGEVYPGPKSAIGYEVAPTGVLPPSEVDSLTINVTDASGVHRGLDSVDVAILTDLASPDTTWRYTAFLSDGAILRNLVVATGEAHDGLQLTALAWGGDEVVACSGDCGMYPNLIQFEYGDWPLYRPIRQAYFPPLVDILGG